MLAIGSKMGVRAAALVCLCFDWVGQTHSFAEHPTCAGTDRVHHGVGLLQESLAAGHPQRLELLSISHAKTLRKDSNISQHGLVRHNGDHHQALAQQSISQESITSPSRRTVMSEKEIEKEVLQKEIRMVTCVCLCLVLCFSTMHLLHRNDIHFLPDSVVIIACGVLLGMSLKYWAKADFMREPGRSLRPSEFLNLLLLPPIMFEAGWMMRRRDFISQLPSITIFAVLGTVISAIVIGLLIHETGRLGLHRIHSYRSAFTISSIISATDPVATLGTYSHLNVDPLLNIIVSGEAILNDAVAIVLFGMLNADDVYVEEKQLGGISISFRGLMTGARVFGGSVIVGMVLTVLHCWMLRAVALHDSRKLEILLVITTAYLTFAVGEFFEFSGIISCLANGILMGQYARPHLHAEGSLLTTFLISQLCTVIDTVIFLLCGVAFLLVWLNRVGETLACWLMLFCLVGRFCSTYPCGWLCNSLKRQLARTQGIPDEECNLLSNKYLFMIWHAGLRGAIALWMTFHIGDWMDQVDGPGTRLAVESAILVLVIVFIAIFGGTTKLCLFWLDIEMGDHFAPDCLARTEMMPWASNAMMWVDQHLLFPSLVGKKHECASSAEEHCGEVDAEIVIKNATKQRGSNRNSSKQPSASRQKSGQASDLSSCESASESDGRVDPDKVIHLAMTASRQRSCVDISAQVRQETMRKHGIQEVGTPDSMSETTSLQEAGRSVTQ